jgi:hypothetical protein
MQASSSRLGWNRAARMHAIGALEARTPHTQRVSSTAAALAAAFRVRVVVSKSWYQ